MDVTGTPRYTPMLFSFSCSSPGRVTTLSTSLLKVPFLDLGAALSALGDWSPQRSIEPMNDSTEMAASEAMLTLFLSAVRLRSSCTSR